ncbi:LysR family transcriptional regulator [Ideonella sp.]|uniref:LysR family transcriptional regulator n=1 Tax=Ideonella sp. TaxID=1929293 RepID=UPI002B497780|nr:LysR family transcriptional regulator [Ideonella sp.]HJV68958.1 LysR family transcriptional regulator [Ideonella sp.]
MKRKTMAGDGTTAHAHPDDIGWLIRSIELGSMSAAAQERNTAVSQVTRAIDRLEAGYGVRLLRRSTHGLSLTPEGAAVVAHGRDVLARLAELSHIVAGGRKAVAGPVRVAASAAIADELVVPALPMLQARHPALHVELIAEDRIADLPTEGIDVALRTAVGPSESVVARRLGEFRRALYASPAYLAARGAPATPEDLPRHTVITHTGLGQFNRWRFRVEGKLIDTLVSGGPAANSTWLIQRMIRAGMGIGLVSMPLAARMVDAGELVEVLAPYRDTTRHTIYAVVLPERQRTPRIRAVVDFLASITPARWTAS